MPSNPCCARNWPASASEGHHRFRFNERPVYLRSEKRYNLTGQALEVIAAFGFPVHILTKSDMVLKDLPTLQAIQAKSMALVSFTITTVDDDLARQIEPGAPLPSARLDAIRTLADHGILTGVLLMPVLPRVTDDWAGMAALAHAARDHGAGYILPSMGMTLRDRQRAYYYARLDELFPGLRAHYAAQFGGDYYAPAVQADALYDRFTALCESLGLATTVPKYQPDPPVEQLALF
jgi:DNA repair photolyase